MADKTSSPATLSPHRAGRQPRNCASCEQTARFITPVGLFCPDHAMAETLRQEKGDDRWMPVPLQMSEGPTVDLR
jgi:hypothetical protein